MTDATKEDDELEAELLARMEGGSAETSRPSSVERMHHWPVCRHQFTAELPPELLAHVLAYMTFQQLSTLRSVAHSVGAAATDEAVQRSRRRLREALTAGFHADGVTVLSAPLDGLAARLEGALGVHRATVARKFRQILFVRRPKM